MKKKKKIEIIYKPVDREPYITDLFEEANETDELLASQKLVGGHIEVVPVANNTIIVCNEEGLLDNLPPNTCGMVGNFFIVNSHHNGNFKSITEDDKRRVFKWLEENKNVQPPKEPSCEFIPMTAEEFEEWHKKQEKEWAEQSKKWLKN